LLESFIWEAKNLRLTKDERKEVSRIARLLSQDALATHPSTSADEGFDIAYARACKWQCSSCGADVDAAIALHCGADFDLNESMFNILGNHSLPFFYFGASEGDGADFGWWLDPSFEDEFDGLKVSDTSEVPTGYSGEVLHVNDHGNMTLYSARNGRLHEIWAIV
jgi:hypothetical protein